MLLAAAALLLLLLLPCHKPDRVPPFSPCPRPLPNCVRPPDSPHCPAAQSLADDVAADDPEWPRLAAIPGLTEPWGAARDKWRAAAADLEAAMLAARARRQQEDADFEAALAAELGGREAGARALVAGY